MWWFWLARNFPFIFAGATSGAGVALFLNTSGKSYIDPVSGTIGWVVGIAVFILSRQVARRWWASQTSGVTIIADTWGLAEKGHRASGLAIPQHGYLAHQPNVSAKLAPGKADFPSPRFWLNALTAYIALCTLRQTLICGLILDGNFRFFWDHLVGAILKDGLIAIFPLALLVAFALSRSRLFNASIAPPITGFGVLALTPVVLAVAGFSILAFMQHSDNVICKPKTTKAVCILNKRCRWIDRYSMPGEKNCIGATL